MATAKAKTKSESIEVAATTNNPTSANQALKLEMSTRDDIQVPRKAFPLVVADNRYTLRATRGTVSEVDYLTFNFCGQNKMAEFTADCDVVLKEGNDLRLLEGSVACEEVIATSAPNTAIYTVEGTDVSVVWRNVCGVVTATLHICDGPQLPKNTECIWVTGDELPRPLIPGSDKTGYICSTHILGKTNMYFSLDGEGHLKTGRKPVPTGMNATLHYIADE